MGIAPCKNETRSSLKLFRGPKGPQAAKRPVAEAVRNHMAGRVAPPCRPILFAASAQLRCWFRLSVRLLVYSSGRSN
jgi:hypothetical protein